MPVDAAMTVRLDCNHTQRQVKLHLVKSHSLLVRKYEGTYTVLPWAEGQHPPALPEGLADTLGPDVARQLHAKLADVAAARSPAPAASSGTGQLATTQHKGSSSSSSSGGTQQAQQQGKRAGRRPRQSLVILHQRLQPGVRPPPGLGGYVRGEAAVLLACFSCSCRPAMLLASQLVLLTGLPAYASCIDGRPPSFQPHSLLAGHAMCSHWCHPAVLLPPLLQARCGASLSACLATCTAPPSRLRRRGLPCRVRTHGVHGLAPQADALASWPVGVLQDDAVYTPNFAGISGCLTLLSCRCIALPLAGLSSWLRSFPLLDMSA